MRYLWLKEIGRPRALRTGGCANAASAAIPLPTEGREGSSSLMGDTFACHLDGIVASMTTDDGILAVHDDGAVCAGAKLSAPAMALSAGASLLPLRLSRSGSRGPVVSVSWCKLKTKQNKHGLRPLPCGSVGRGVSSSAGAAFHPSISCTRTFHVNIYNYDSFTCT